MVVQDEMSSINQKSNKTMSVMLCTGATFVKKNSCLVARIVSFDTAVLHLLTFRISVYYFPYLTLMTLLQYPPL